MLTLAVVDQYIREIHQALHEGPAELTDDQAGALAAFLADLLALRTYLRDAGGRELAARLPRN